MAVSGNGLAIAADFVGTVTLDDGSFDSGGDWDAYVLTLEGPQLGVKAASRVLGGASEQRVAGVAFDGAGRLLVAGTFQSELQLTGIAAPGITSAGDSDIFVARFDVGTLEPVWLHAYGDAAPQHVAGIAADARGGIAIAGGFSGTLAIDGAVLNSAGSMDAFFATIDENGAVRRARRFGDQQAQHAGAVAMSRFGSVYVAGTFRGTVDFGQGPVTSVGDEDAFVAAF